MLKDVVLDGHRHAAAIPGYQVAGKTGTAQKPIPTARTRVAATSPRSSASCRPRDPRLVILVAVDEPHGAICGGVVAAPAFAQIAKFDLQYLDGGITPDAPSTALAP